MEVFMFDWKYKTPFFQNRSCSKSRFGDLELAIASRLTIFDDVELLDYF